MSQTIDLVMTLRYRPAGLLAPAADAPAAIAPAPCEAALSFPSSGGIVAQDRNPGCITVRGLGDIDMGDAATGLTGSGFGRSGDRTGQDRFRVEGGVTF